MNPPWFQHDLCGSEISGIWLWYRKPRMIHPNELQGIRMELLKLQAVITKNILWSYHTYVKKLNVIIKIILAQVLTLASFINTSVKDLIISDQDLGAMLVPENTISSSKRPLKSNLRFWFRVRVLPSRLLTSVPIANDISLFNLQSSDPKN